MQNSKNQTNFQLRLVSYNYRNAEVAGELRVAEAAVTGELRLAAGDGGVTAVDGGDSGGVGDGAVEEAVGDESVLVGEVEEVVDGELVSSGGFLVGLVRRELAVEVSADVKFRPVHRRMCVLELVRVVEREKKEERRVCWFVRE